MRLLLHRGKCHVDWLLFLYVVGAVTIYIFDF